MRDATDGPDEIRLRYVSGRWAQSPVTADDRLTVRYRRADRNCLGCKHGTAISDDARGPFKVWVSCPKLPTAILSDEIILLSDADDTARTFDVPGDFCCSLWEIKE